MNGCLHDPSTLNRLASAIETIPPLPHHSALTAALQDLMPDCEFSFALTRGGWYRPGGVIGADGRRVADDLENWAERRLAECDGDLAECIERHAGADLLATRHVGRSHYFVAAYGSSAGDFVQLEVEELQEVFDRRLFDPDDPPADLAELTEPLQPLRIEPQPVGRPYYRLRRLTDVCRLPPCHAGSEEPMARFMAEWQDSLSGPGAHFSGYWVLGIQEHTDRYLNVRIGVTPIARHARKLKGFQWEPAARGLELAGQIQSFDRIVGYPGAWYFHMVTGHLVPHAIAYALKTDLDAGFNYLSDSGVRLLGAWLERPYSV